MLSASVTQARGLAAAAGRTGNLAAAGTLTVSTPLLATAAGAARRAATDAAALAKALGTATADGQAADTADGPAATAGPAAAAARGSKGPPGRIADHVGALLDAGPRRARRRVWARRGRAHIEVRGLGGTAPAGRRRRLTAGVTSALNEIDGVRWAEVNAVTGHVLAAFDEEKVDPSELVAAVAEVEHAHHTEDDTFSWDVPPHPADPDALTAAAAALAADWLAFGVAVTGKVARLPALPGAARVVTALVDLQPPLRRGLERRLGPRGAELAMALARAAIHGMTQDPSALAVDAMYRVLVTAELRGRRDVWCAREAELCAAGLPDEAPDVPPRPRPMPSGPVETYADRAAAASLAGAAGVLALTRAPARAGEILLAAVPRAACLGREGFATVLGRELARSGVVPMDGGAYRRLDRVGVVVIDANVLCRPAPQVLSVRPARRGVTEAQVWQAAGRVLAGRQVSDLNGNGPWRRGDWLLERASADGGPPPGPAHPAGMRLSLAKGEGPWGEVQVGCELDPLADAVLAAARDTGARVLLTEHASAAELVPSADGMLTHGTPLTEHVRRLQQEGRAVLLVSQHREGALHAADVSVAVMGRDAPVGWSADLICGPGLEQVWRILQAVPVARHASERSVRYAIGGSSLGALLAVTRAQRNGLNLAPVHTSTVAAMLSGALAAGRLAGRPLPSPMARVPWHALDAEDAVVRAGALREAERSAVRLRQHGAPARVRAAARALAGAPVLSAGVRPARGLADLARAVRDELRDPLTPVLLLGAGASAVVGSGIDAVLVGSVMAGNALVSGAQRLRAEQELRELLADQQLPGRRVDIGQSADGGSRDAVLPPGLASAPVAKVPVRELHVGDVIALGPADVVPADARLVLAEDLEVDESSLTGESLPASKSVGPTPSASLGDRACMVYEGTTVVAGHGFAVVVATGAGTQSGRATAVAGRANPPLGAQAQLDELTKIALPATGIGGGLVTGLAMLRGRVSLRAALASGIAVAVAAVPEGLPLVATVAQLGASRRLSRRDVLVRSSRTLATLGRADTVCFDKTGTLTEGRLTLSRLASVGGDVAPGGDLGRRILRAAVRASPQVDPADPAAAHALSHATDRAVVEAGRTHLRGDAGWERSRELPFEANRGFSATAGTVEGRAVLAVKGAPEVVLPKCRDVLAGSVRGGDGPHGGPASGDMLELTGSRRRAAQAALERLAGEGLRVLAVAEAPLREQDLTALDGTAAAESVGGLTLLGFVGIADTPRADAAETIGRLKEAGTRVLVITGDHQATASAIARRLGIPDAGKVLTGADLDRLAEDERVAQITESAVFARITPEHKVRIVQALQRAGRVVAMIGDGANDAAAIRLADVGIGVTGRASAAARTAADLVIREADIGRVADALLEGRSLWASIQDAVSILVGGNAGEVAFTVLGTAVGGRAPLSTRQLLLVNMLTDMMPALAVALAPPVNQEDGLMAKDPARAAVGRPLFQAILVRGAATALGATLAWQAGRVTGRSRRAGTMGLAALVAAQLGQTLQTRWRSPSVAATSALSALVLAAVIETPGVSQFFGCTPIGPLAWSIVGVSALAATAASALAPRLIKALGTGTGTDAGGDAGPPAGDGAPAAAW